MREIILASASPRRRELLAQIGIPFRVQKSGAKERITKTSPEEIVRELSSQKAEDVAAHIQEGIVLGADTIVYLKGEVMGKPKDRADAAKMLERLQGQEHAVYTGVTLIEKKNNAETRRSSFAEETRVRVHAMDQTEIERYLDTGDAFDKAGSYGIQGPFAAYIDGIAGDYYNVVGLPVAKVYQALKEFAVPFSREDCPRGDCEYAAGKDGRQRGNALRQKGEDND